jgi:hypothetical protein
LRSICVLDVSSMYSRIRIAAGWEPNSVQRGVISIVVVVVVGREEVLRIVVAVRRGIGS